MLTPTATATRAPVLSPLIPLDCVAAVLSEGGGEVAVGVAVVAVVGVEVAVAVGVEVVTAADVMLK